MNTIIVKVFNQGIKRLLFYPIGLDNFMKTYRIISNYEEILLS